MSQVAAAIMANNLGAMAVGVLMKIDGVGDLVIEAWPAAMAFELVLGSIKGRVAATANERARISQIGVPTGEWPFCAFADDDVSFLVSQFVVFGRWLIGIHNRKPLSAASGGSILRNRWFPSICTR